MSPAVGLRAPMPSSEPLLEVSGKVRYTAIKINPLKFTDGRLSLLEINGKYSLGFHGKAYRQFQLSGNIQSVSSRFGHITIVLVNGYQVIAKDCEDRNVKLLEKCLSDIKNFRAIKSWSDLKRAHLQSSKDRKHNYLENSKKIVTKVDKSTPLSSQRKQTQPTSPFPETPSKRGQIDKVKGRLQVSPFGNKENTNGKEKSFFKPVDSVSKEDEEVSILASSTPTRTWSRPTGEKRTHSPVLRYGCSPSSSPLGFSTIRSKSPKSKKRLLDHSLFNSTEKDSQILVLDDNDEENNWSASASKTPISYKRTYESRKSFSSSPLRPKMLQDENKISTFGEQDKTCKVSSFYATPKSSLFPSLTGKKFYKSNSTGKGLKRPLPDTSDTQEVEQTKTPFIRKVNVAGLSDQTDRSGFPNLGNTCYMNAILQCLLGIPAFAQDLSNPLVLKSVAKDSLFKYLHILVKAKRNKDNQENLQQILKWVKEAISKQADRFVGFSQHDAHEFLGQCLDQLKDDVIKSISPNEESKFTTDNKLNNEKRLKREATCPVARNFECQITHNIKCDRCGNQVTKEEVFYDISLDIGEINENSDPADNDIQELLQDYFMEEEIQYKCEKCECKGAHLSHNISRLPRVIILHLKRYEVNDGYSKYNKKLDRVNIPMHIDLGALCTEKTKQPLHIDRTPKGSYNHQTENETPYDMIDTQPTIKAKRKLSLSATPVLSNPENAASGLTFTKDSKNSTKLSLDIASEEDQLKWALAESMKADQTDVDERSFSNDNSLPSPVLQLDLLSRSGNKNENVTYTYISETFTGLKEKNEKAVCERTDSDKSTEFSECLPKKATENAYDPFSYEGISQLGNGDHQLKLALELSLNEYENQKSAEKLKFTEMQCNLNARVKSPLSKKKHKVAVDINAVKWKYRLIGVVSHIGDNPVVGHYLSDVFDHKELAWKTFDDQIVMKKTENEIRDSRKKSAYILFYMDEECFKLITNK